MMYIFNTQEYVFWLGQLHITEGWLWLILFYINAKTSSQVAIWSPYTLRVSTALENKAIMQESVSRQTFITYPPVLNAHLLVIGK